MNSLSLRRVEAIHPHWEGFLKLSNTDDSVEHVGHASKGTYDLTGNILTVRWETYAPNGPDVFFGDFGNLCRAAVAKKTS
jgi:hypothetical protein